MAKKWEELTKKEKQSSCASGCVVIGVILLVLVGIICGEDSDEAGRFQL